MDNNTAIAKWGLHTVTIKRADEIECGNRVLYPFYPNVTFPYTVANIEPVPDWNIIITFKSSFGEGEPHFFKETFKTNHCLPIII